MNTITERKTIYIETLKKALPQLYKNGKTDEKCPFCNKKFIYDKKILKCETDNCFIHFFRTI